MKSFLSRAGQKLEVSPQEGGSGGNFLSPKQDKAALWGLGETFDLLQYGCPALDQLNRNPSLYTTVAKPKAKLRLQGVRYQQVGSRANPR